MIESYSIHFVLYLYMGMSARREQGFSVRKQRDKNVVAFDCSLLFTIVATHRNSLHPANDTAVYICTLLRADEERMGLCVLDK